jgi:hypothetical protein
MSPRTRILWLTVGAIVIGWGFLAIAIFLLNDPPPIISGVKP